MTIYVQEFKQDGAYSSWIANDKLDLISKIAVSNNSEESFDVFKSLPDLMGQLDEFDIDCQGKLDKINRNHSFFVHQNPAGEGEKFLSFANKEDCEMAELEHWVACLRSDLRGCEIFYTKAQAIEHTKEKGVSAELRKHLDLPDIDDSDEYLLADGSLYFKSAIEHKQTSSFFDVILTQWGPVHNPVDILAAVSVKINEAQYTDQDILSLRQKLLEDEKALLASMDGSPDEPRTASILSDLGFVGDEYSCEVHVFCEVKNKKDD